MPPSKVLPFRAPRPAMGWEVRVFAGLFYLFLAWCLLSGGLSGEGLNLLGILGLAYWAVIRKKIFRTSYYHQNKVLILLLIGLLLFLAWPRTLPLLVLAGIFWAFIWRSHGDAPFFLRYHLLTALVLDTFLLLLFLLLGAGVGFVESLANLTPVGSVISPLTAGYHIGSHYAALGLIGGSAAYLAIAALTGRTPYIPVVSGNVRAWA